MSDGGPGFVDVLNAALGGELLVESVSGPFDETVPATVLLVGDTAYVESAQACGSQLLPGSGPSTPARRSRRARRRGDRCGCPHRDRRTRRERHERRRCRDAGRPGSHGRRPHEPRRARHQRRAPRRPRTGSTSYDEHPPGRRHRRRQPADRPVRCDPDLRCAEGHFRGAAAHGRHHPERVRRRGGSQGPAPAGRRSMRARIDAALALGPLGDPRFERRFGPFGSYLLPPLVTIAGRTYPSA